MFAIYRQSWAALRENWIIFGGFAAIFLFSDYFAEGVTHRKITHVGITLWLTSSFIYALHRHFLFNEKVLTGIGRKATGEARSNWKFFWLLMAFLAVAGTLSVLITKAIGIEFRTFSLWQASFVVFFLLAYLAVLVLLGSAMPAFVAGDSFGFSASVGRIRKSALPTLGGLLIGSTVFGAAWLGILIAIGKYTSISFDILDASGNVRFLGLLGGFIVRLVGLFNTTLAVAALCIGYRRSSAFLDAKATDTEQTVPNENRAEA